MYQTYLCINPLPYHICVSVNLMPIISIYPIPCHIYLSIHQSIILGCQSITSIYQSIFWYPIIPITYLLIPYHTSYLSILNLTPCHIYINPSDLSTYHFYLSTHLLSLIFSNDARVSHWIRVRDIYVWPDSYIRVTLRKINESVYTYLHTRACICAWFVYAIHMCAMTPTHVWHGARPTSLLLQICTLHACMYTHIHTHTEYGLPLSQHAAGTLTLARLFSTLIFILCT